MDLRSENERLRKENEQLNRELHEALRDGVLMREQIVALMTHQRVLSEQVQRLSERVRELEAQLAQDSHNSNWPSSRDKGRRQTKSLRKRSGKKAGGQEGHAGQTLKMVDNPDHVIEHRPEACADCGHALAAVTAEPGETERRQVFDLPPLQIEVTEHRTATVVCPGCGKPNIGEFPSTVSQSAQYGPEIKALCVYLQQRHLLPVLRLSELVNELFHCSISPGSVINWLESAGQRVAPMVEIIKTALHQADVVNCDETGFYVAGKRNWLHVNSTARLTYYHPHDRRGGEGIDAAGILPDFTGIAMHDGWAAYARYACRHALCNAHHLRELTFVKEQYQQEWAETMIVFLLDLKAEIEQARQQGLTALEPSRRTAIDQAYQHIIDQALAANPEPPGGWPRGKRGGPKQPKPRNLTDRLDRLRHMVLAFADDFRIPFDNNLVERDIRMVKVQQKISGCFRSWDGAKAACDLRSYLSTLTKQGHSPLLLLANLFRGQVQVPVLSG
jgi:transposase